MSRSGRRVRRGRSRQSRVSGLLLALVLLAIAGLVVKRTSSLWLSWRNALHSSQKASFWAQGDPSQKLALLAATSASAPVVSSPRIVYQYSVIPGGVHSPGELRELTQHDPAIGRHYEGFDFNRARIIELDEPRLVYLSYRIGNNIYWTSKRVALRKGEKLITDGKITARTRCANRVSETAQKGVSPEEPPAEKFEEPFLGGGSTAQVPFPESAMKNFSGMGPDGPPGFLTSNRGYGPTWAIGLPPVAPPPVPGCPPTNKSKEEGAENSTKNKPCASSPPVKPPPPVPEPGTMLLVASGLAGIYWRSQSSTKTK